MRPPRFGRLVHERRTAVNLTASHVARVLGVSVVYWRDIERGRRVAPSPLKIDFEALAEMLGTSALQLKRLAAIERGQLELDFSDSDRVGRVLLLLVDSVARKRVARATLATISRLLRTAR